LGILKTGNNFKLLSNQTVREGSFVYVEPLMWHKLSNVGDINLKLIEVQFGSRCTEEDIERIV
jgi:mannose-6-phosphate isomerase-like protein (cupin superfamily)